MTVKVRYVRWVALLQRTIIMMKFQAQYLDHGFALWARRLVVQTMMSASGAGRAWFGSDRQLTRFTCDGCRLGCRVEQRLFPAFPSLLWGCIEILKIPTVVVSAPHSQTIDAVRSQAGCGNGSVTVGGRGETSHVHARRPAVPSSGDFFLPLRKSWRFGDALFVQNPFKVLII